ncbi:MAG: cytochrome B [Cyclobacteriaceae bacterium]|nr:cytochrome B [Cyclobacteriaceae bacterium]
MKKEYIYKRFERFWHWSQASLIMFLSLTGFEVHDSIHVFGFEKAVMYHRIAAYLLLALIVFAIFWHFTTGEWKQYIPSFKNLKAQIRYYTVGIFNKEGHPTRKTALQKLNPLQVLTYLSFKIVLIPLVVITGVLYMLHKQVDANSMVIIGKIPLDVIAIGHTFGAFMLITFLIVHVYMTTTGRTLTSNIKAMITGYEELEDVDEPETDKKVKKEKDSIAA